MIISSALPSRHVLAESRECACIFLARLSLAEIRDHLQSKACKSTDSLADLIVTRRHNELYNGLERWSGGYDFEQATSLVTRCKFLLGLFSLSFTRHLQPLLPWFKKDCERIGPRRCRSVFGSGAAGLFLSPLSACVLLCSYFVRQILRYGWIKQAIWL